MLINTKIMFGCPFFSLETISHKQLCSSCVGRSEAIFLSISSHSSF
ncbi:hypothetical protein BVRB_011750 [Beta vulgaris subsp. vulgaris]|uniref:Uncharacterized protein n=1 Tax=Beta vulgaris subsp. vulgaris TaxID=3555 RepID=A0A0J8B263_BETVV|nr:hypothetical protein BVRB_011750 [Beta vulgaris subsp. vulgaris]